MGDPSLAVQKALRARLIGTAAVIALVPAQNILDRNQRPAPDPSIVLGEDQTIDAGADQLISRTLVRVYSTVHIWKREPSLAGVKTIAGAIRRAIGRVQPLDIDDPNFVCADCRIESTRFMRDSDGETSHGIVVVNSLIQERWSVVI